jgi:hypothetical protein
MEEKLKGYLPKKPGYRSIGVPGKYYEMVTEQTKLTRVKRDPRSGRLMGRYTGVKPYQADARKYLVMTADVDLYGDKKKDLFAGQIIGRVKKEIRVKPRRVVIYVKKVPGKHITKKPVVTKRNIRFKK